MIRFEGITKKYDGKPVVSDITLEISRGDLVVLIGQSGCGKTTLLKIINRLIKPTSGRVFIQGENIFDKNVIDLRRNIGYVIQQTGLFPHMTVRENIEIVPRLQKKNRAAIAEKSIALMQMVGLNPELFLDRYPYQLSGGQQQRIGVARAFACDPDIILMDEPFSALDPISRNQLQEELAELQSRLRKTIVFVTHDMDEAVKIADKICILHQGRIAQYDRVEAIMKNPASDFVAEFMGRNRIWSSPEFIRAKDIMIADPACTGADASILRCMEKMRLRQVDSLLVTDKAGCLQGIISAKQAQSQGDKSAPVFQVMQKEFETLSPDTNIVEILTLMNRHSAKALSAIPVTGENRRLEGLITRSSLLTTLSQPYLLDGDTNTMVYKEGLPCTF
ncbi:MAG: ABC transporter ATP-binding protein [Spirochaetaceae bacterium]|jgi:osmoprotectant transport system ATP-binding protein|nr:ABC transporter ATP-binding protein [Spirochaetaceae bacterium]